MFSSISHIYTALRWQPSGILRPDDGGSKHLRNVNIFLRNNRAQYPKGSPSPSYSPPWKPELTPWRKNPKVHHRTHNSPPPVPVLSQSSRIHPPQANLPKIHSDAIFSPTPWSSKWSLYFGLSHQNLVHYSLLSHACHMPCPPHSPWLDLPNDIWGWAQIMKLLTVQLPPFSRHPEISLNTESFLTEPENLLECEEVCFYLHIQDVALNKM
jgi:hypothetical protein